MFKCSRNGGRKDLGEQRAIVRERLDRLEQMALCCVSKYSYLCPSQQMPPSLLQSTWKNTSGLWILGFVCYQQIAIASIDKAFHPL